MSKAWDVAEKLYPQDLDNPDEPYKQIERSACAEGYYQAEKDLGWISVKDKLPGPSEWVVACIEQHGHAQCLTLATYNEETKVWHTDKWENGEQEIYNPDYWMPIPNRIKEE